MANLTVIIPVYNEEHATDIVATNLPVCAAQGIYGEVLNIACGQS